MRNPVHVILDDIRSAFNVGSAFRTADAALVERIHCCGITAYPPNPKLEKTSLGAADYVPWTRHETVESAMEQLTSAGIPIVGIEVADGSVDYTDFRWPKPVAVLFGNEVRGVRPEVLVRCDHLVQIPMRGVKNSLNIATAFGVVLFEILRRWKAEDRSATPLEPR